MPPLCLWHSCCFLCHEAYMTLTHMCCCHICLMLCYCHGQFATCSAAIGCHALLPCIAVMHCSSFSAAMVTFAACSAAIAALHCCHTLLMTAIVGVAACATAICTYSCICCCHAVLPMQLHVLHLLLLDAFGVIAALAAYAAAVCICCCYGYLVACAALHFSSSRPAAAACRCCD